MPAWARRAQRLPGAVKRALPHLPVEPQLPTLVQRPPKTGEWLYEIKWDGYRTGVSRQGDEVRVWTRNGHDWTARMPWLASAVGELPAASLLLDGEVIHGAGRKDDFEALQATLAKRAAMDLSFVAFDLLYLDGVDLRACGQAARKDLLAELLATRPARLELSTHVLGNAEASLKLTRERGYEGVVIKRANGEYVSGRSEGWLKIKHVATEELAVVGYIRASTMRQGAHILLLAKPGPAGWVYAGRVKGLGEDDSRQAGKLIGSRGRAEPSVDISPAKAKELGKDGAKWFAPLFVVEVHSRGSTASRLRQPTFKAFRPDKSVHELAR